MPSLGVCRRVVWVTALLLPSEVPGRGVRRGIPCGFPLSRIKKQPDRVQGSHYRGEGTVLGTRP